MPPPALNAPPPRDIVPLGKVRDNFNFSLDDKRVLNMTNVVNDDDNIKQVGTRGTAPPRLGGRCCAWLWGPGGDGGRPQRARGACGLAAPRRASPFVQAGLWAAKLAAHLPAPPPPPKKTTHTAPTPQPPTTLSLTPATKSLRDWQDISIDVYGRAEKAEKAQAGAAAKAAACAAQQEQEAAAAAAAQAEEDELDALLAG